MMQTKIAVEEAATAIAKPGCPADVPDWCAGEIQSLMDSDDYYFKGPNDEICDTRSDQNCASCSACQAQPDDCDGAFDSAACVFPFSYHGVGYNSCTDIGTGGTGTYDYYWCATAVDGDGAYVIGSG